MVAVGGDIWPISHSSFQYANWIKTVSMLRPQFIFKFSESMSEFSPAPILILVFFSDYEIKNVVIKYRIYVLLRYSSSIYR